MSEKLKKVGRIAFIGAANAGKSTLVNALVGSKVAIVSKRAHTTRQRVMGVKNADDHQLVYIDTPGLVEGLKGSELKAFLSAELRASMLDIDYLAIVIDAAKALKEEEHLEKTCKVFARIFKEIGIDGPNAIVFNKCDLFDRREVLPLIEKAQSICTDFFSHGDQASFLPISAVKGFGVKELESEILSACEPGPNLFPDDVVSSLDDEVFAAEVIREKAFSMLRQEIPYGLAVVCRSWEHEKGVERVFADIVVEKDSHRPIVLGSGGKMLSRIGRLAREELQRIYGGKFYLKVFVRVEKDWTRTPFGLEKIGYREEIIGRVRE